MAIIGVRDLVRTSRAILDRVVDYKEPFLITKHGQPIAALVPIDPAEAESYVLASAPEFVETRRVAERAGSARETQSLEAIAEELGIEDDDAPWQRTAASGDDVLFVDPALARQVEYIFGHSATESVLEQASERVASIFKRIAEKSDLIDATVRDSEDALVRIGALNQELFRSAFHEALADNVAESIGALAIGGAPEPVGQSEAHAEPTLLGEALDEATAYVSWINESILSFSQQTYAQFSIDAYEIGLRAGIAARSGVIGSAYKKTEPNDDLLPLGFKDAGVRRYKPSKRATAASASKPRQRRT